MTGVGHYLHMARGTASSKILKRLSSNRAWMAVMKGPCFGLLLDRGEEAEEEGPSFLSALSRSALFEVGLTSRASFNLLLSSLVIAYTGLKSASSLRPALAISSRR